MIFIRLRPWWKAPALLARRPGVALALATAALVAALPAAGFPLFLSASQSASIARQIDDQCALPSGASVTATEQGTFEQDPVTSDITGTGPSRADLESVLDSVDDKAAELPGLGAGERTLLLNFDIGLASPWQVSMKTGFPDADGETVKVYVMYSESAEERIDPVSGTFGPGVWVPDDLKKYAGIDLGDTLDLSQDEPEHSFYATGPQLPPKLNYADGSQLAVVPAEVTGVYETLNDSPRGLSDWCHLSRMLQFDAMPEGTWAPTVLVDEETFWQLASQAGQSVNAITRFEATTPTPSLEQARLLESGIADLRSDLERSPDIKVDTELPRFIQRAELVESSLSLPIASVSVGAIVVGLCVVGGATVLWARRRRVELTVLAGRGSPPLSLGVKGALEALPAIVVGAGAGLGLAWYSRSYWAPSEVVTSEAVGTALLFAAAIAALALLTVVLVAAAACRGLTESTRRSGRLGYVPWELAPAALAALAWFELDEATVATSGDAADRVGEVVQLPGKVFVVPLLASLALAGFVSRLAWRWLGRRTTGAPPGVAGYLAKRRIRRDRAVAVAMLAAVAVPTALAGFAVTASASAVETMDAQARAKVGADLVVGFKEQTDIPAELRKFGSVTEVVRVDNVSLGPTQTSVLFVDPETFADVADTADILAGRSVTELLGRDGTAAQVVAGGSELLAEGPGELEMNASMKFDVDVAVVAQLPAPRSGHPVVLASLDDMPADLPWINYHQWWIDTDEPAAAAAWVREHYKDQAPKVQVADELNEGTSKEPVTQSFDYLIYVAILTAVVVVVGLLLQLESRSPAYRRSYVLMRRMGLAAFPHWAALLREIGVMLVGGVLLGVSIAAVLVLTLADGFDVDAERAPSTLLTLPWPAVGYLVAAVVVTAVSATWFTHARIVRAKASEVLRDVG